MKSTGRYIEVGQYRISELDDGSYWIQAINCEREGEGMQTSESKLVRLLDDFWNEEF